MTTQEHIYAVKNILNQGPASSDSRISNSLIAHYLKVARALLLHRKLQSYKTANDLNFTTLCIPLVEASYHDCECIDIEFDCKIYKSRCQLPKEISGSRNSLITIKSIDGVIIPKLTITQNNLSEYSLVSKKKQAGWLIENQNLILLNAKAPFVLAKAIWEDPEIISNFCDCKALNQDLPCYDASTDEFPIDGDLVLPMYEMALQFLSRAFSFPIDMENNARPPIANE